MEEELAKAPPMTQEEILKEAEEMAKLNLESLERFQKMELEEKKKHRTDKIRAVPTFSQESDLKAVFNKFKKPPPSPSQRVVSGIRTPDYDPLLQYGNFNRDNFKVLLAEYNRIMYQRGDRRKYYEWLEQHNADAFNTEIITNSDGEDSQEPMLTPSNAADLTELRSEEISGNNETSSQTADKKTPKNSVKMPPPPLLSIEAGSRTGKSVQSTAVSPLRNAKRKEVNERNTTPSPAKSPKKAPVIAATVVNKDKSSPADSSPLKTNLSSSSMPSPVAQVKAYGPAKSRAVPISSNSPVATTTSTLSPTSTVTAAVSALQLISNTSPTPSSVSTSPETAAPASSSVAAAPTQLPAGLASGGQGRRVLIARRNLTGPLAVASSGGVPHMAQKSQPIVIRNVTSNQLSASGNTVLQSPLQIPTSRVQLAVSGTGGTSGVAFLNLRGNVNVGSIVQSVQRVGGIGQQVVRLIQQQSQFIHQTQPLQQSTAVVASGNPNLPVSVRFPGSSALQLNQNSTSAAMCSTPSAIVAANTSAVQLAARIGSRGAIQVVASRPVTGTNTVVARGTPIHASSVTTGSRLSNPAVETVRSPGGGTMRPTAIRGPRTITLTASQLQAALSQGTLVKTASGTMQVPVIASGANSGNITIVRDSGTPMNANTIRANPIPASSVTTGSRLTNPAVATVRNPGGGTARPTAIRSVRTTTLRASQVRTALSQGTLVKTASGTMQGTVVASRANSGNINIVQRGGTPMNANPIREFIIPSSMGGVTTMAQPHTQQGIKEENSDPEM